MRPQNSKELFNLQHSALRNVVERTIGVFKHRFRYFEAGRRNLPLRTQVEVVYALTAVHNFINMYNLNDLASFEEGGDEDIDEEDARLAQEESDVGMNGRRDEIARLMWNSYCQVISRPIE